MSRSYQIAVIGLGYIGLPTAVTLSKSGNKVFGVDINSELVTNINRGQCPIKEDGLNEILTDVIKAGLFRASTKLGPADVFIVAVPTPFIGPMKKPDLSYVEAAVKSISKVLQKNNLIIIESTCPVGATQYLTELMEKMRPDLSFPISAGEESDIRVAYCPERVIPGRTMLELTQNDRIVGGQTDKCYERAKEIYDLFLLGKCIQSSSPEMAELSKLAENSFRDVNIAFANEMHLICDRQSLDVHELIRLANRHPRVNILEPGPGVGGHCIAVDPWFLINQFKDNSEILQAARSVNDGKPDWIVKKVMLQANRHPDKKIICIGLTYKKDTGDFRGSPSLEIYQKLAHEYGQRVFGCDPYIDQLGQKGVNAFSQRDLANTNDILVCLVKHREFDGIKLKSKVVVDACGFLN